MSGLLQERRTDVLALVRRGFYYAVAVWTVLVALLLFWAIHQERKESVKSARIEANAHAHNELLYRGWISERGGIYVPVENGVRASPYLADRPERDLTTPSGRELTLVNPSHLTRLVHATAGRDNGLRVHVTSLNPMRPENAPDAWEAAALRALAEGEPRQFDEVTYEGEAYMRTLRPLRADASCLACHADQGFAQGEIIGGLSVAVPMRPHLALSREHIETLLAEHGLLWMLGVAGLYAGRRMLERVMRRRALLESTLLKLSEAVEQGGESVVITDRDGIIEYVNPAFTQITGYAPEEVIGRTPAILKSGYQDERFYAEMWRTIGSGEVWHGGITDRRRDGSFYPAMMSIAPIRNPDGEITHYVGIQQDMSEHEQLEEKFRQAQKMEAIGTLVGGIAHDFNNVLTGITGKIFLARQELTGMPGVARELEDAEELGFHAAEMIQQLLAFARKGTVRMRVFDFTSFVKEAFKLNTVSIPENIDVETDFCAARLRIKGDTTQLQQVMLNLLSNARDALEGRPSPTLRVSLQPFEASERFLAAHDHVSGRHFACLTIEDNGAGIRRGNLDHIFEPFFTTKEVGRGTGLGLAMVYGAVKAHGGTVEVDSEAGAGTVFRLYFPLDESEEKLLDRKGRQHLAHGQGELVLIVDDDEHVRRTNRRVLNQLGYEVCEAADGEQALETLKRFGGRISAALVDVVMPRMGGVELARRIGDAHPEMPVIFITGYDRENVLDEFRGRPFTVLSKPFSVVDLSQRLRDAIAARSTV